MTGLVQRRQAVLALLLSSVPSAAWAQALPSNGTTAVRYDLMRREIGTIAPDPDGAAPWAFLATRKTYDPGGRLTKVESGWLNTWHGEGVAPSAWTGFTVLTQVDTAYDAMDRKVREAKSGGGITTGVTEYGYDQAGRLKCTAVRMNPAVWASALTDKCVGGSSHAVDGPDRITRNSYTATGEIAKIEKAVGTPLQQVYAAYTYSPNGKATSVTDANGNKAEMVWDGLDRQKRWVFPSKTVPGSVNASDYEEYGYDANANRTSLRKRDGVILTYLHDAANRMSQKTVPASVTGAPAYSVHYGYDNRGLQAYARFGSASGAGITNAYDGFGQVSAASTNVDGTARTLNPLYDVNGNRTGFSSASSFGYVPAFTYDGLDRMTALHEAPGSVVAIAYDSAGRRSTVQAGYPNLAAATTTHGYDSVGRLSSLGHDLAGTSGDQTFGFTYNSASQIQVRTGTNAAYASTSATNVVRPYAANGLNQYSTVASNAYLYDDNGNLTSDGTTSYVYDSENRLVSASGLMNASLAYDPLGRLWQTGGGSSPTTRFFYDGDELVVEYSTAGAPLHIYLHGPGTDEPLVWYEISGTGGRRFLKADHQGSIVAVADSNGTPVAINAYDPWGVPNSANLGRFGYTGQTWVPQLGMWYYKARLYSPMIGRFMQVDPIGYDDQINLYAYVGNDPVNSTDPEGTCTRIGELTGCGGVEKSGMGPTQYAGGSSGRSSGRGPRGGSGGNDPRGRGSNPQTPGGIHQANIEARVARLEAQVQTLSPGYAGIGNPAGQRTIEAVRTLESTVQTLRVTPIANNMEARAVANALGYRQIGERSSQQPIFTNGKSFITRDIPTRATGSTHNGGVWKVARTPDGLRSRDTRAGTFNRDLTSRMGD